MTVYLTGPDGAKGLIIDTSLLKEAVLEYPMHAYWKQGSGDAVLEGEARSGALVKLLILPNSTLGIYLKYLVFQDQRMSEAWLSLGDSSNLDAVADCGNEWYASIGLFLTPDVAWRGIEDFIGSLERSSRIQWIQPSQLPPKGNW